MEKYELPKRKIFCKKNLDFQKFMGLYQNYNKKALHKCNMCIQKLDVFEVHYFLFDLISLSFLNLL